jgi:hypothetical protein
MRRHRVHDAERRSDEDRCHHPHRRRHGLPVRREFHRPEFNFPNPAAVQYVKGGANKLTLIGVGSTPGMMMLLISAHVDVTYERPAP